MNGLMLRYVDFRRAADWAGLLPDHFTFAGVLKACGGLRHLAMVNQIHGVVLKSGFESQELVVGSFIDAYAKCKSVDCARLLYDSLPDKDLISSTAMITSYARGNGGCGGDDPLKLFALVNQTCAETDDVIVCTILGACADLLSLSMGRQIHGFTFKKLPGYDAAVGNALIDMYAKSGELEDARRVFEEMPHRNVISWTSMITACGRHGHGRAALTLLEKMESDGCEPNDVTFLAALSACGHAGLTDEGWRLFNSMIVDRGILPRSEHYACFVDLLARGGRLEEAYDFVSKMRPEPSSSLWGALLGACRVHGDVSLGQIAAVRLFHLEPKSSVNYVVLSNIYASACLWEAAMSTRRLIDERSMQRSCGYSSIHSGRKGEAPLLETN